MVKTKLRKWFRDWLGITAMEYNQLRQIAALDNDIVRLLDHAGLPHLRITAGAVSAQTIKAGKIKASLPKSGYDGPAIDTNPPRPSDPLAEAWATKLGSTPTIRPLVGHHYKTRDGRIVGPMKQQGNRFFVTELAWGWTTEGEYQLDGGRSPLDLVAMVPIDATRAATEGWPEVSDDLGGALPPLRLDTAETVRAGALDKGRLADRAEQWIRTGSAKLPLTDGYRTPKEQGDVPDVLTEVPVGSCDAPTGAKLKAIISHLDACKSGSTEHAYDRGWNDALDYAVATLSGVEK